MTKLVTREDELTKEQNNFLDNLIDSHFYNVQDEIKDELVDGEFNGNLTTEYWNKMNDIAYHEKENLEEQGISTSLFTEFSLRYFSAPFVLSEANKARFAQGKSEIPPRQLLNPMDVKHYEDYKKEWMKELEANMTNS